MRGSLYRQLLFPLSQRWLLEGLFGKQFCGTVLRRNRRTLIIWTWINCLYAQFLVRSVTAFIERHNWHFFGLASSGPMVWRVLNILYDTYFCGRGLRFLSLIMPVSGLIVEVSGQETEKHEVLCKEFILPDEDRNLCFICKKWLAFKSESVCLSCHNLSSFSEVDESSLSARLLENCPLYSHARQNKVSQSHSRP